MTPVKLDLVVFGYLGGETAYVPGAIHQGGLGSGQLAVLGSVGCTLGNECNLVGVVGVVFRNIFVLKRGGAVSQAACYLGASPEYAPGTFSTAAVGCLLAPGDSNGLAPGVRYRFDIDRSYETGNRDVVPAVHHDFLVIGR